MAVDSAGDAAKDEKSASSPAVNPKPAKIREEEIREVARKLCDQPFQRSVSGVWGVLTAVSDLSRKRPQGMNIFLTMGEHCFGRCVEDSRFRIVSLSISAKHCTIYRERASLDGELDLNTSMPVFVKDTSTNGTYLNWTKLEHSSKTELHHGDIISFAQPPNGVNAYAFVYREISRSTGITNGTVLKRKSDDYGVESKRLKGIGIGAPEGPISLDDVRSLQRSNTELRQQLESQVHTIETLRSENRATIARHENELKDLKEKVSSSYIDQIKELQQALDGKQKEIDEHNTSSAELRRSIDDLKERLQLSNQSRADADEIMHSQKVTISELEAQLSEERSLRREERQKAEADLKSALQKAHSEAQEEIMRQADVYLKQHKEQQEVICKLQESEKESRVLLETLRSKLEDARENVILSEKKVRELEVQVQDEQVASAICKKRSENLDAEVRRLRKEHESEKVAREEAWAKVSSLELEIAAAIRDLSIEKQRFQGARERIILRETQLRAFYSTTEEITALFAKQQEQLKSMQKTLEDEENYSSTLIGMDLNEPVSAAVNSTYLRIRDETQPRNNTNEDASGASTPKNIHANGESSEDGSTTEKNDCDLRSQDGNTQDLEYTSSDRFVKNPNDTQHVHDGEDPNDTERVLGTETQSGENAGFEERTAVLHKCSNLEGDTMQLDDDVKIDESLKPEDRMEDTENNTIRTADLLASEVAGSWGINTAPSVYGENESPQNVTASGQFVNEDADGDAAAALLLCSEGQASGSQSNIRLSKDQQVLNAMIEIVAPEFGQQFRRGDEDGGNRNDSMSDAETQEGGDDGTDDDDGVKDGDEVMIEDSVG